MRYSYEFKRKCVEMYREGLYAETPEGIGTKRFRSTIREWARIEDACGPDALRHKNHNKEWTVEERYELVSQVLAGNSNKEVALSNGISQGQLYQWVQKYKINGYNGLYLKKGRTPLNTVMKKENKPKQLTESEYEELIRLRAENEFIKAENEVIKKQIALRHEKWAAQLKAKKQQSSKNSEKKDSN